MKVILETAKIKKILLKKAMDMKERLEKSGQNE